MKVWRIWLVFFTIILLFAGVVARLFYWQFIATTSLRVKAVSQYTEKRTLVSKRGEIITQDGSVLVTNQPTYLVFAEPHRVEDRYEFSRLVSPILNLEEKKIVDTLSNPNQKWVSLVKQAGSETKQKLETLQLMGIGFEPSTKRFYPEASMAAHVLGFVGQDSGGEARGYFGLEGFYNKELSGKNGVIVREKDARGVPILIGQSEEVKPEDGRTLTLWIDRSIQHIAQKRLLEGMRKYGASEGTVIIMDPKSGGILAMASYPNYEPERYSEYNDTIYKNPAVAESYEPGSTFKPLIMAAAINEKTLSSQTTFDETGPVTIGEYSIKTWDEKYHNTISMVDVLRYSSNVGMVFVQRQLGKTGIVQYIKEYGFGEKTNVDLEEESSPELRSSTTWGEIDYATAAFGQGIAVTPLQLTRAIGAIANEGNLMEPMVVKEFIDKSGKSVVQKPRTVRQILRKETVKEITDMMVAAVKYGEAKWAAPKGYKVAGKTGTAQIPVQGHYDEKRTIASFVGFAPAYDPKFVMLVVLREPKTSQWGSETAAPLFFTIVKDMFSYLGIAPTNE